ncbi:MAG: SCO family protein, partial [Verrucomicrobiota bacterium]
MADNEIVAGKDAKSTAKFEMAEQGNRASKWIILAMVGLLLLGAIGFFIKLAGNADQKPEEIEVVFQNYKMVEKFDLIDHREQAVNRDALDGKVTVVNFIFTSCAAECPFLSRRMSEVQTAFIDNTEVQFLTITVDPRTDNPERLAKYAGNYGAGPNWRFLTGDT